MKKLTMLIGVCTLLAGPVCLGQSTGGDKSTKSDSGKKATKGKKEKEAVPPQANRRMPALPADVAKAIMGEEAKLNANLAGCRKAADTKACRSEARNSYSRAVSKILSLGPQSSGAN